MPTSPKGTVHAEHVWKRFRADRSLPLFQEQIKVLGKWLKGHRRDFRWVLRDVNMHVEPGKTYGFWLNSERFTNFRDRQGRSAVPYLFVFKTKDQ